MAKEDKELLLKDLCARLPYGVICLFYNEETTLTKEMGIGGLHDFMFENKNAKPYLRPMSSMTEEERRELLSFGAITRLENGEVIDVSCVGFDNHAIVQDYLNSHHFDYRNLIEKGLAIAVTEENNPYNE